MSKEDTIQVKRNGQKGYKKEGTVTYRLMLNLTKEEEILFDKIYTIATSRKAIKKSSFAKALLFAHPQLNGTIEPIPTQNIQSKNTQYSAETIRLLYGILAQLKGVCTNYNQIVKRLNSMENLPKESLQVTKHEQTLIQIGQIVERLRILLQTIT